jgi:D-arginine dehydrogenase
VRVLVVGGGMAGVSIGYELAARAEVVLVEQEEQLAYHTTGRSAAMYLQSYGNRVVRAITVASRGDFDRIQREFETSPLLLARPMLYIGDSEHRQEVEDLVALGGPLRRVDVEEAMRLCPAIRRERLDSAALDTAAMVIDVPSLHQAYVRGLVQRGGDIRRAQPVTELRRDGSGWSATTPSGSLRADAVVNASGAWADVVAGLAGVRPVGLRPLRRTIFTSPVPGAGDMTSWPFVADAAERFYFHGEHDQVLVSPADEIPDVPRDARPEESDVAAAMEVVNEFTTLGLRSVRRAWAGLRSFVADRSPVVGWRAGEEGFVWFAGQGGYGIQMAPGLARAGAALLLDGRLPDDIAQLGVTPAELSPARLDAD